LDFDECAAYNGNCDPLSVCTNLDGGYSCAPCPDGYLGSGDLACFLPPTEPFIGLARSCALEQSGHIYCWGLASRDPPLQDQSFVRISGSTGNLCGLEADGSVTCRAREAPPGEFDDVVAGGAQDCGLRPDHTIECWGSGPGVTDVPPGTFTAVANGYQHVCALRPDGTVECWGSNAYQQLYPPPETFTTLCSGQFQSCGLRADGSIACWGDVSWLSDWTPPPSGSFEQVFCGDTFACAMDAAGSLACWGQEAARVPPTGTFVTAALSGQLGCALTASGSAVCWGKSFAGETSPP
jgi:hypothetical protein